MFDAYILVNFGGPRTEHEVYPFLKELLCDQDVVRTGFYQPLHNLLFSYIAKKRSRTVGEDYQEIGGASPIFSDTEELACQLRTLLKKKVLCFHRYLPSTHAAFINDLQALEAKKILAVPLFPQFSYATTGSCARFFENNLCGRILEKIQWIPSYAEHPSFIEAYRKQIEAALNQRGFKEEDVCLFYSFHGVPKKFICFNDPYQHHCTSSFEALKKFFPQADHVMAYQSKFGKGEWLRPYTIDLVEQDLSWLKKKHVFFVPLSFTSDHIETLFEIQMQYIKPLQEKGISAFRISSLQGQVEWLYQVILSYMPYTTTSALIRTHKKVCCQKSQGCCVCKKNVQNVICS